MTGGTGFIGQRLRALLEREGAEVELVSRRPGVGRTWEPDSLRQGVAAADVVIHLAGAGVVDRRWSDAYKREILESRVATTERVAAACDAEGRPLVSTSAVGYYGARGMDEELDEDAAPGDDFLADVCRAWETAARPAPERAVSIVRVGVVLGTNGGALEKLLLPFRLGLGGPIGRGDQPFPWVHVDDVCRLYAWLAADPKRRGVWNAAAPGGCTQGEFARTLGRVLGRPALLPTPVAAMRLLLGERSRVVTTGQRVVPRRSLAAGFEFAHPDLDGALRDLLDSGG